MVEASIRSQILLGEISPALAKVYVRFSVPPRECSIQAKVIGPFCAYSSTLPAQIPLQNRHLETEVLAEGLIPDPCFWSPDMPFLYQVEASIDGPSRLALPPRVFGIRLLTQRGGGLFLEGKGWVLRAAHQQVAPHVSIDAWREAGLAMVAPWPNDALCEAASQQGVFIVADLDDSQTDWRGNLDRLCVYPAVGIAIIPADTLPVFPPGVATPLLARRRLRMPETTEPKVLTILAEDAWPTVGAGRPAHVVLAERRLAESMPLELARRECDRLQRDLAGRGHSSGYLV